MPDQDIPKVNFDSSHTPSQPKEVQSSLPPTSKRRFTLTKKGKITAAIIILLLIPSLFSIVPVLQLVRLTKATESNLKETVAAVKAQDFPLVKQKLDENHRHITNMQQAYKLLVWWKITPLRWHYTDGENALFAAQNGIEAGQLLITAVEPYIDVLGFKGEGTYTGGTTEDRIVAILDTLDDIAPSLDAAIAKLKTAQTALNTIDPDRYPIEYQGKPVGDQIKNGQDTFNSAVTTIEATRPALDVLPELAGVRQAKKYLILFQNDAELRPTGGFMTAYAILDVNRGKIAPERSDDIYELDAKFTKRLAPPEAIKKYFPLVPYWYLRDMNLSPDFKVSMDTFYQYYQQVPGEPQVNGIIAIDTNVLKNLVEILGPIDVPGFGIFSADTDEHCNCPQVIYKLEDLITRPVATIRSDRKAVLGPLMQTILQKAYDSDSNAWPALFQSIFTNMSQKHLLFYMLDEKTQTVAENLSLAGRIKEFDGDYFHLNDTNFGGAKSNLFITQEVEQEITFEDGATKKHVTIIYKNPSPASNCNLEAGKLCLNGVLRDYVRIFVPEGSTLVESLGFEEDSVKTYTDLGKTVIEGFFKMEPQSQAKLVLTYTIPYIGDGTYEYLIQKQPGTYNPKYTITFDTYQEEFELTSDKTFSFSPNQ